MLELFETLVPQVDVTRFAQMASWQATLDLAEINAPHGFMRYYRSDLTTVMAGSPDSSISRARRSRTDLANAIGE